MMMKCGNENCGKTFLHPGKLSTVTYPPMDLTLSGDQLQITAGQLKTPSAQVTETLEVRCCPYCKSLDITVEHPKISSVVSVDLAQVDEKVREGYEVHELYAKSATLIKREVTTSIPEVPTVE